MQYKARKKAIILLADGTIFYGKAIGKDGSAFGEVCFNTGMTGYQEILFLDRFIYLMNGIIAQKFILLAMKNFLLEILI